MVEFNVLLKQGKNNYKMNDDKIIKFKKLNGFESIAKLFDIPKARLWAILISKKEHNYTSFEITKKNGSKRKIHAPIRELAALQKKLSRILALIYTPMSCVHGFTLEKSIKTNTQEHF
ncbi:hypothetical protein HCA45_04700 [Listeria seeligeri]|uniref:hypothetical protein n=3 Tax=Listeria seeligeri TaxID=1640 RepID=UPI001626F0D7|nr:hypothetical protein [Listeria seeligeri]MBC2028750.1 hypothetical protein [Listeria seeligeri]MBC2092843.1 hypothetical protein [Listeria seeligeri]MBC6113402.1 hypothetical protein [Listeria seeligeri]